MFLRFFAATHLSELGELGEACLTWVPFLCALDHPVRLVPTHHSRTDVVARRERSGWAAHAELTITPMDGDYVNIVCCLPEDWKRLRTIGHGCQRNVLLAAQTAPVERPKLIDAALEYEVLIVPTIADAEIWTAMGGSPIIIPPVADRLEDFRAVIGL